VSDERSTDEQSNEEQSTDDEPGGGRRRRPITLGVAAALLVGATTAVIGWREPPPPPDGLVVLYGDSLSLEAGPAFEREMARTTHAQVVMRAVPGEAPCDALDQMREDVALDPDVVVIQYVGNNATRCTLGPDGQPLTGQALVDRYEADVRAATELFATDGIRVVLVGGPDTPGLPGGAGLAIADAYVEIVNEWAGRDLGRVRYADAAATVTGDDHTYVPRLPCRDDEGPEEGCEDGEVVVRNPDRIHFCPVDHDGLACPVPAPGAERFAEEIARVAAMALDPGW
jgi:hypothetical protein